MNIQAREGVCHGANCILDGKLHNIYLERYFSPRSHPARHRIGPHTRTDHTVPYGTARLGRAVPGTSCQATIMQSLRDILPVALTPPHAHGTALVTYQTRILHLRGRDSSGMRSSSSYRVTIVHDRHSFDLRHISQQPLAALNCGKSSLGAHKAGEGLTRSKGQPQHVCQMVE
jgi:hypothetical protein